MGYDFKYDFPERPKMDVDAETILSYAKTCVDYGYAKKSTLMSHSKEGDSLDATFYEITPSGSNDYQIRFDIRLEDGKAVFTGTINGIIDTPDFMKKFEEEKARFSIYI